MSVEIRKKLKTWLGHAAGMSGAYNRAFRTKLTIVAFHRVNNELSEDALTCTSRKFEAFCDFFRNHFRVISLSEQVASCHAGKDVGGTLSITFDDGYLDNFEVAAPILRKLQLPATFFVTTGFIGTVTPAPWDNRLAQQPGWMTWEHLRSLVAQGFEIGSHTDTHINLGVTEADAVRAELALSRKKLQEQLGRPSKLFAYPFGGREHISEVSRKLVQEAGFDCCVSCCGGTNPAVANPYNLNRVGIADWFDSPDQFGFELAMGRV
jgi:peptidoglycan/xylan/chitin deacetylase (PgdA/CDA1 family)